MRKTTQYTEGATLPTLQEKITYFFSSQLKRLVANITVDLWVCGNLFLSGEYGFVQAPSLTESEARHLLLHAIEVACKREKRKIAGVLLKDCLLKEGVSFQDIEKHGFHPFKGDPIMMMQIPAHWHNFEDYLNDLSSKYRQRAKSAFKKSQSLQTRTLSLEDVAHLNDQIFPLFENVVAKSAFNLKTTPRKYFISLKKYLPQMVKMTGYFEEDRLVGFMTTIQTNDHLEAHFLGYNDTDNHAFKLYQRMLYDMIGEAIETKAPAISFGRTAMEIKTTVGAVPQPANMFLRLRYGVINLLAGTIIRNIKNEPFVPRHPFKGQEHLEVAAN
jgi:predicted N-acyltransferase